MKNRGLLTDDDRQLFQGEKTTSNTGRTKRKRRMNISERIQKLERDLKILHEAGEEKLVREFFDATRTAQTELDLMESDQLDQLRTELQADIEAEIERKLDEHGDDE